MKMPLPLCKMCKDKEAKTLTAKKGDKIYINAQNKIIFCSVRCAANWALLWFNEEEWPFNEGDRCKMSEV